MPIAFVVPVCESSQQVQPSALEYGLDRFSSPSLLIVRLAFPFADVRLLPGPSKRPRVVRSCLATYCALRDQ
jgi:hypothetical protein